MATRRYQQRLRAEHAAETRRRILAALDRQLRNAPGEPASLDAVARRAKVARSTIYLIFGSKAGLFDALAEDLWARTGLPALTEAVGHPDAREHLRGGIAAASAMYAADRQLYRVLHSMAQLDPDAVGGAIEKVDRERRGGMAHLARRLAEAGALRDDVSVEDAEHVLWVLCSFDSFDALYTGCALPVDRAVDLLATTAERTLCRQT
ncbi:MAG TPA: helix-turn-helix domain-containing protein [Acidimicrobiales bacterium]